MTAIAVSAVLGLYLLSIALLAAVICRGAFHIHARTADEAKAKCIGRGDYDEAFLGLPW